jgi:hypothetical protein
MLRRLASFVIGLAIAIAIWVPGVHVYNRFLAAITQPLVGLDSRLAGADLVANGRSIAVRSPRGNFPPIELPADQLSYNVILLLGLFASNRSPLRDRNVRAFAISLLIVIALHPIGALISIESTYAGRVGEWSEQHYGDFAADAWLVAEMFYRLVGMFGIVFACWFVTSQDNSRGNV